MNWDKHTVLAVVSVVIAVGEVLVLSCAEKKTGGESDINGPSTSKRPNESAGARGGARFTDKHSEEAPDANYDGKCEGIRIDIEIEISEGGNYGVYGTLKFGERKVTSRPIDAPAAMSYFYLSTDPGQRRATLTFSGADIYEKGMTGVYTIELRLIDERGACIDVASFETQSYSYTEFGE